MSILPKKLFNKTKVVIMNRTNTTSTIALDIEDLTVAYHSKPALWDVDLKVPEGGFKWLLLDRMVLAKAQCSRLF